MSKRKEDRFWAVVDKTDDIVWTDENGRTLIFQTREQARAYKEEGDKIIPMQVVDYEESK